MEILVNGQAGLASTEDDVELGSLFAFLRQEFASQRLAVRRYHLDGAEVFPDEDELLCRRSPSQYSKLEIEVAPFEIVAVDVLRELEASVPELSASAVRITELYQKADTSSARDDMRKFIESVHYVTEAMRTISSLTGVNVTPKMEEEGRGDDLKKLGEHLQALDSALGEGDLSTVGDVMEFDIAPSVETLVRMLSLMREEVERVCREKFPAE